MLEKILMSVTDLGDCKMHARSAIKATHHGNGELAWTQGSAKQDRSSAFGVA